MVGAGPTGLTAAAEALRHGLSVRIIEKKPSRSNFSKALVVHARTMETFALMGIDQEIREQGTLFAALNLHFNNRRRRVRVDLIDQPWGDTDYPYWLSVPQYDTERVLERHLRRLGGDIEWSRTLTTLEDDGHSIDATVRSESGEETIRARWVIGCDGGRSTVRDQAGITLKRTGAGATFLLADVKTTCELVENEGHLYLAPEGLLILVPMPERQRWRMIAHVASDSDTTTLVDATRLDELILERTGITFGAHDMTWASQFDLSHGVADRFSSGRIFLAGDAAHIHSPVGGQGLNTGVLDAHSLLWRLSESRHATPEHAAMLIRAYGSERRGTAEPMVRGVARMTSIMTSRRYAARQLRSYVTPHVVSRPFVQAKLARGVGMLNLSYSRRLTTRGLGQWGAGHRLPNPLLHNGERLYERVRGAGYSWVILDADEQIQELPDSDASCWLGLPVAVLSIAEQVEPARSRASNRVVLVRPDRYIAGTGPDPQSLHHLLSHPHEGDVKSDTPTRARAGVSRAAAVATGAGSRDAADDSTAVI